MTYIILLDSSNTSLTVALADSVHVIDSISYEAWQCQSEHMIPELDKLLNRYRVDRKDIKKVVTTIGPGSYTGVRISLTIAKIIATALDIDIYALSSLSVLKDKSKPSICLINARSNRSYFGVYHDKEVIESDKILSNEDVKKYIEEHPSYSICGNTKYLGIEGVQSDIAGEMFSLLDESKKADNVMALTPIYMKD